MTEKITKNSPAPTSTPINCGPKKVAGQRSERVRIASGRSPVTNGNAVLLFGDGRSPGARRFRDLVRGFSGELGEQAPTESDLQVVRRLAQVSVELELMEATRANGGDIDPVAFVTLVNGQRRLLRDLEAIRKARAGKNKGPGLHDYLAQKSTQHATEAA